MKRLTIAVSLAAFLIVAFYSGMYVGVYQASSGNFIGYPLSRLWFIDELESELIEFERVEDQLAHIRKSQDTFIDEHIAHYGWILDNRSSFVMRIPSPFYSVESDESLIAKVLQYRLENPRLNSRREELLTTELSDKYVRSWIDEDEQEDLDVMRQALIRMRQTEREYQLALDQVRK